MTYNEIIECLYDLKDVEKVVLKEKKFGIVSNNSLGIYHKELKMIAKEIGQDNELALQLFDSEIYEGRLLCSKMFKPKDVNEPLMEKWVRTFENWEICDSFSMGLFSKSKYALVKIVEWTERKPEFEKRAGFAIMASYCMADKTSENDNRGINVKRGLRTRCEMGLWPTCPPTGYFKEKRMDRKCECLIDEQRAPVIKQMFEKVAYEKWSGRKIYHWLRFELNFRTEAGKKHLSLGNIYRMLENPFYYGTFEYPRGSGNWYQGKHKPIITKELFDLVRDQVKNSQLVRKENIEFAFTKIMKCGLCGSGISAMEKFKKLKNGDFNRHVYYGCTKAKDKYCKCGYINETDLVKQLQNLTDKLDFKKTPMENKIKSEVKRFKRFQAMITGKSENINIDDIDIQNYARFILKEGEDNEKRELLSCLGGKIKIIKKSVMIK